VSATPCRRSSGRRGGNFDLEAWDWRFYAEKLRKRDHDLDEAETKPYFQLDRIIEAAFDTARRLFGLAFSEVAEAPRYHPDIRVFEVRRGDDFVGLFIGDYFARPSKRSGAWMSAFRSQEKLTGDIRPVIVNVMNFAKAEPTLLSFDDARTLFTSSATRCTASCRT
jgi:peptidyl-dipeptidase Dcp